jgi:hypothetical protein
MNLIRAFDWCMNVILGKKIYFAFFEIFLSSQDMTIHTPIVTKLQYRITKGLRGVSGKILFLVF